MRQYAFGVMHSLVNDVGSDLPAVFRALKPRHVAGPTTRNTVKYDGRKSRMISKSISPASDGSRNAEYPVNEDGLNVCQRNFDRGKFPEKTWSYLFRAFRHFPEEVRRIRAWHQFE